MACMWQNTSPALYRLILSDGVLTLPGEKYMTDTTVAYLKARKAKLTERELCINVIFDEVFVQQLMAYLSGVLYGMENDSITKTLLMIKSVAGPYRDIVAMSPMSVTNCDTILTVWKNVVKRTTDLGFNVVATTSDGHKANMKMFKKPSCAGRLENWIYNPYDESKNIFLLFDTITY